jgi:hypothetical protein
MTRRVLSSPDLQGRQSESASYLRIFGNIHANSIPPRQAVTDRVRTSRVPMSRLALESRSPGSVSAALAPLGGACRRPARSPPPPRCRPRLPRSVALAAAQLGVARRPDPSRSLGSVSDAHRRFAGPVAAASPIHGEQHGSWRFRAIRRRSVTRRAADLARRTVPSVRFRKDQRSRKGNSRSRRGAVSDRQASSSCDQARLALGPVTGRAALSRHPCSSTSGMCLR